MDATNITRVRIGYFVLMLVMFYSVSAQAQLFDVAWTFGNVGSSSYRLNSFESSEIDFGTIGSEDPTLPLELGKRYQVQVLNYTVHPLEIIAKSTSPTQDNVLLSMAIEGPFESDPQVNWEDDGQGTVRFTLTLPLYQAMTKNDKIPGYHCRPHFFNMRGDFLISGLPIAERISPSPVQIELETIASGLTAPIALVPDPQVSGLLYLVDQAGKVHIISDGQLQAEPFLDVADHIIQPLGILGSFDADDYDERGLLGFAIHPDFADAALPGHHKVYTYTSEPVQGQADFTIDLPSGQINHQSVITEWQLAESGSNIDSDSARVLLRIDQPQFNHNGGAIAFGPDGYLYIALGDGGGANDTNAGHGDQGNGQNLNTVHGSILRIDPIAPELTPNNRDAASANGAYRIPWDNYFIGIEGIDEIYAYGFRNPFRFSFDMLSGMLIVADVGQDYVEEINIVRKGFNYGWNVKEGDFLFDPEGQNIGLLFEDAGLIDPVAQYDHDDGLSIIGGYMYYGTQIPELRALYVFGDFSRGFRDPDGRLFVADLLTGQIKELLVGSDSQNLNLYVKGIGQDHDGEIYILASSALGPYGNTGVVLKIVPLADEF
jgi:glucose/arabinose dehydrogenase